MASNKQYEIFSINNKWRNSISDGKLRVCKEFLKFTVYKDLTKYGSINELLDNYNKYKKK